MATTATSATSADDERGPPCAGVRERRSSDGPVGSCRASGADRRAAARGGDAAARGGDGAARGGDGAAGGSALIAKSESTPPSPAGGDDGAPPLRRVRATGADGGGGVGSRPARAFSSRAC